MTLDPQTELMLEYSELLVPDEWDTFSVYQRNQYWKRYKEKGEYSHYKSSGETGHYVQYRPDQLTKMDHFATVELLEVVFERDGKEVGRGGGTRSLLSYLWYSAITTNGRGAIIATYLANGAKGTNV